MRRIWLPHTLRGRLIAMNIFLIFLSLFSVSAIVMVSLRGYQAQVAVDRLVELSWPVSREVRLLIRAGATPAQIFSFLEDQARGLKVRFLLLDSDNRVVEDTEKRLAGQTIPPPTQRTQSGQGLAYAGTFYRPGKEALFLVRGPILRSASEEDFIAQTPLYTLILAVPQRTIASAWLELAPSLVPAALLSLIISLIVATLLSYSLSRPLGQITRAAEEIARGNYDQAIREQGTIEIRRLAQTFNTMARQVNQVNKVLRQFMANVSHELKTPLTSVIGFSQALLDGAVDRPGETLAAGQRINEEARRMNALVNDLLYVSKVTSQAIPMEKEVLNVGDLLASTVKRVRVQAEQKGIEICLKTSPLPPIKGDPRWLEHALSNLMDNAVKHTSRGGRITVGAINQTGEPGKVDGASSVSISVHNTGSVIPPLDLPRIFDRFYQVDSERAPGKGVGLGLAIVKEVAEAHGGVVSVQSSPTQGTEFTLTLPG